MAQQIHTLNISLRDADETNRLIQMLNVPHHLRVAKADNMDYIMNADVVLANIMR